METLSFFDKFWQNFKKNLNPRISLVLPYFVFALILIVIPLILLFVKSVSPLSTNGSPFDNHLLVKEQTTWQIIARSIFVGLISAFICLILAFPYAFIVANSKSRIFKIYSLSLIITPLIIFTIAKVFSLRALFLAMFDEGSLNNNSFMILGLIFLNFPFMVIPLYTIFRDMPKNLIEAGTDLGYSKFWVLIKVVLPYSFRAISSGFAIVFLMAATSIVVSDKLLPNGSQNQLIGNLINNSANTTNPFDLARVSSLVLVTLLVFIGIYTLIHFTPIVIMKLKGFKYD
ncbi:ABC transporter permease [Mesomycoplasma ovipneumoniae]|uniref:ABC transporter permease subunit n=1 Tax=Mesomycoplasma ovipneumoniae TaxID=29562 RepID=A0AAP5Y237_9BACT|nr:ABC transporter permease subunit [Mesomycoplasma ovipneumoniae]MDW2907720.1 ABC transporter permease subunit [Mesomycoplasma ovipneumoniae]MDW2909146.1 ABC transporter permease subunit [Mesomycoplasma ovipneumoniae]MDW2910666.1 ABC transporter permease subunit [Mesomycoplasma ovipneumoniae]MDW2911073.1 ABC transporter permease subunit [Mesomycoplasma ovipneumoniae]MDW2912095.1 ABC transporter permease subunit [Mesomycoplasma ovipneumoniae]